MKPLYRSAFSPMPRQGRTARCRRCPARASFSRARRAGNAGRAGGRPGPASSRSSSRADSVGGAQAGAGDQRVEADRIEAERVEERVLGRSARRCRAGGGDAMRATRPRAAPAPRGCRAALSTSLAPCLMSAWQPRDCGEWIEPGIANTSRPASSASRAVISEPDCTAASTTSVPRASAGDDAVALIGKFSASGGVPSANSLTIRPSAAMRLRERAMPARVDDGRARCRRRRSCRRRAGRARLRAPRRRCRAPGPRRRPSRRRSGAAAKARAFSSALRASGCGCRRWRSPARSSSSMRPRA